MKRVVLEKYPDLTVTMNTRKPRSSAFEISIGNKLIWSKFKSHTFPQPDELLDNIAKFQKDPSQFEDAPVFDDSAAGGEWCSIQ
mmetsp:Transcript_14030/g.24107  ORF Transcript_14030/g.24107 Transcript_14030/m.24107 type:complete len:84 (+) Transcript_14030:112-363(+)